MLNREVRSGRDKKYANRNNGLVFLDSAIFFGYVLIITFDDNEGNFCQNDIFPLTANIYRVCSLYHNSC